MMVCESDKPFRAEKSLQTLVFVHFLENIAAADQLSVDV